MEVSVFPEAYINNSGDASISNSNNTILCRNVLEKYKDILCSNPDGCIFKLSYTHPIIEIYIDSYVSCLEFSAPDNTIFVSNDTFDKMFLSIECNKINIELFNPPQASSIIFTIEDCIINNLEDIKSNLEMLLSSKYKFLQKGQEIPFLNDKLTVKEIEPYDICLVNNTDLTVEFDIINIIPKVDNQSTDFQELEVESDQILYNSDDNSYTEIPVLSNEELREKRLAYFLKK